MGGGQVLLAWGCSCRRASHAHLARGWWLGLLARGCSGPSRAKGDGLTLRDGLTLTFGRGAGKRGCIAKPKQEHQRTEGQYGYGAFKDEAWSMQALEKRIYAVRDYYKHVLKGVEDDNPGEAQSVKEALAMLRLIVGYKPSHVPKVS